MLLDRYLTEYDESIGSDLNIDPLGMQVIWSAYGQQIFRNRVSSISNDVRNYTLNLFNHWIIKHIGESDSFTLSNSLSHHYPSKHELNFKFACLIYLENLYVYSMIAHQKSKGVTTTGVLGITNARREWELSDKNPLLLFSHDKKAQVLVRQILLGVSGRYKTPLVEMGFFDRQYQYTLPNSTAMWRETSRLVEKTPALKNLGILLLDHMRALLAENQRQPQRTFSEIPVSLTRAFADAFPSPAAVGKYACDFWLGLTELNKGAAGALYEAMQFQIINGTWVNESNEAVFARAALRPLTENDRKKLEHVQSLEPFLGEMDLLFSLMMSQKNQSIEELVERWHALGRSAKTLAMFAGPIATNAAMFVPLSNTGRHRLDRLLQVSTLSDEKDQVRGLVAYHGQVMESRGQLPWIKLKNDDTLRLDIRPQQATAKLNRRLGEWVNQYYLPQYRNLLSGLWGLAA